MKNVLVAVALVACIGISGVALGGETARSGNDAVISLTFHQQLMLLKAVENGVDQVLVPLTDVQQEALELQLPGFEGQLVVVDVSEVDGDGVAWIPAAR